MLWRLFKEAKNPFGIRLRYVLNERILMVERKGFKITTAYFLGVDNTKFLIFPVLKHQAFGSIRVLEDRYSIRRKNNEEIINRKI